MFSFSWREVVARDGAFGGFSGVAAAHGGGVSPLRGDAANASPALLVGKDVKDVDPGVGLAAREQ